jgi:hypothetical protein
MSAQSRIVDNASWTAGLFMTTPETPNATAHREPDLSAIWWSRFMIHNSLVLSRDFHDSGTLLKCMTATMSKVSFLIW